MELVGKDLNQKLTEYVTLDGDWNWNKLGSFLPSDCLDILASNKPPASSTVQDQIVWFPSVDGIFNLKSA